MRFASPPRRSPPESVVPMINVVFLLLIFFLISAQISPPDPFETRLPVAQSDAPPVGQAVLFLGADGQLALAGQSAGADQWQAIAALPRDTGLSLRCDQALAGTALAGVMARLAGLGFAQVELVVQP